MHYKLTINKDAHHQKRADHMTSRNFYEVQEFLNKPTNTSIAESPPSYVDAEVYSLQ